MTTSDFYYYDQDNQKQGPFSKRQIKELAAHKTITPETVLEDDDGNQEVAGQVPGLFSLFGSAPAQTTQRSTVQFHGHEARSRQESAGFFDFGFTRFITNTWISFIWIVIVVLAIFLCIAAVLAGLYRVSQGDHAGFVLAVLAPIVTPLFLLFARMGLEGIIVLFRIETHLRSIREHYAKK